MCGGVDVRWPSRRNRFHSGVNTSTSSCGYDGDFLLGKCEVEPVRSVVAEESVVNEQIDNAGHTWWWSKESENSSW